MARRGPEETYPECNMETFLTRPFLFPYFPPYLHFNILHFAANKKAQGTNQSAEKLVEG